MIHCDFYQCFIKKTFHLDFAFWHSLNSGQLFFLGHIIFHKLRINKMGFFLLDVNETLTS